MDSSCEVKLDLPNRLKSVYKEMFLKRGGCDHGWMIGDPNLTGCPEFCNKFIIAYAPALDSLRKVHLGEEKTTFIFYHNDGIMSLGY